MSKMGTLVMEIQEMVESGLDADVVAMLLNVPEDMVLDVMDTMGLVEPDMDDYDDSMDGDDASGLASAGWGTDEDYGYIGCEFD